LILAESRQNKQGKTCKSVNQPLRAHQYLLPVPSRLQINTLFT